MYGVRVVHQKLFRMQRIGPARERVERQSVHHMVPGRGVIALGSNESKQRRKEVRDICDLTLDRPGNGVRERIPETGSGKKRGQS